MTDESVLRAAATRAERAYAAFYRANTESQQGVAYDRLQDAMLNLAHVLRTGKPLRRSRRPEQTITLAEAAAGPDRPSEKTPTNPPVGPGEAST